MSYRTKHYSKIITLISFTILSCTNNNNLTVNQNLKSKQVDTTQKLLLTNTSSTKTDTLTIDKQAAVFYEPDSLQIAERKKAINETDFDAGADDYLFTMHIAYDFLDSTKLTILDAKEKRFLKFVSINQADQIIQIDTLPELWGIYFFSPLKHAKLIDMTMIEDEYNNYFK